MAWQTSGNLGGFATRSFGLGCYLAGLQPFLIPGFPDLGGSAAALRLTADFCLHLAHPRNRLSLMTTAATTLRAKETK